MHGLPREEQQHAIAGMVVAGKVWHVGQLLDMGVAVETEGCLDDWIKGESNIHESLLHLAVRRGNCEMAEFLLQRGAPAEELNENCELPLVMAVERENKDMIRLLMKYGADPDNNDDEWGSAIDVAYGKPDILQLLQTPQKPSGKNPDAPRL